jgi:hypothetical protein
MQECAWQHADNREPAAFPEIHRALIGADDKVELHGAKTGGGGPHEANRGTLRWLRRVRLQMARSHSRSC